MARTPEEQRPKSAEEEVWRNILYGITVGVPLFVTAVGLLGRSPEAMGVGFTTGLLGLLAVGGLEWQRQRSSDTPKKK